jgi:hypothetical protein
MRSQVSFLLVPVTVLILGVNQTSLHAQGLAGWDKGSRDLHFQEWLYVNNNDKYRSVQGVIKDYHWNTGINIPWTDYINDSDLNIMIDPPNDADSETLLRNRANDRNSTCDEWFAGIETPGLIELEIRTTVGVLDNLIANGMNVYASGWWVQDSGHCDKTELHPVRTLVLSSESDPLHASNFTLFLGVDKSGRFNVSGEEFDKQSSIAIPVQADTFRADLGTIIGARSAAFLSVSSVMDLMFPISKQTARQSHWPAQPSVEFDWTIGDLFVGKFQRGERPMASAGFSDTVQYSVQLGPGGRKMVQLDIRAGFTNDAVSNPLKSSEWTLENFPFLAPPFYETVNTTASNHRHHFVRVYSPSLGLTATQWHLSGQGETWDDRLGPSDRPLMVVAGYTTRQYVQKDRIYSIEPSRLLVSLEDKCDTVRLTATPTILPGAAISGNIEWVVWPTGRGGLTALAANAVVGKGVSTPPFTAIAGQHIPSPGFTFSVDPDDPTKATVAYDSNRVGVHILVRAQTDLGESIKDQVSLEPYSQACLIKELTDLYKGLLVLDRHGQLPVDPLNDPVEFRVLPGHAEFLRRLPAASRGLGQSYVRLATQIRLTETDQRNIERIVAVGRRSRWRSAPSLDQLRQVMGPHLLPTISSASVPRWSERPLILDASPLRQSRP